MQFLTGPYVSIHKKTSAPSEQDFYDLIKNEQDLNNNLFVSHTCEFKNYSISTKVIGLGLTVFAGAKIAKSLS